MPDAVLTAQGRQGPPMNPPLVPKSQMCYQLVLISHRPAAIIKIMKFVFQKPCCVAPCHSMSLGPGGGRVGTASPCHTALCAVLVHVSIHPTGNSELEPSPLGLPMGIGWRSWWLHWTVTAYDSHPFIAYQRE